MSTHTPLPPLPDDQPPADATLDDLLAAAKARYAVEFSSIRVGEAPLEILQLADMDAHLERIAAALDADAAKSQDVDVSLPFWAKIWNTSILTAFVMGKLPAQGPTGPRSLLEIGAGVGVVGLAAAAHGFDTTITDISSDAVLFTRINILKNNLAERARAGVVDFTTDRLGTKYDVIVGSEVLYKDDTYRPLTKFLLAHLRPDPAAEIVLSKEYTRKAKKFFTLADREFHMDSREIGFKGEGGEKHLCTIYRMKPRKQP